VVIRRGFSYCSRLLGAYVSKIRRREVIRVTETRVESNIKFGISEIESPCVEADKNTSTVIPASRKTRRKGNRISFR
jgi:hypothetical protein